MNSFGDCHPSQLDDRSPWVATHHVTGSQKSDGAYWVMRDGTPSVPPGYLSVAKVERIGRFELPSSGWKPEALPLDDIRKWLRREGSNLR